MHNGRSFSLTDKLPLYFILLGILAISVSGLLFYFYAKDALLERTFDQLTSVRIEKKKRIEKLLKDSYSKALKEIEKGDMFLEDLQSPNIHDFSDAFSKINVIIDDKLYKFESGVFQVVNEKQILEKIYSFARNPGFDSSFCNYHPLTGAVCFVYKVNPNLQYIFELSQNEINSIMLDNNPHNGLGKSGEAYLVSEDFFMKSRSRFIESSVNNIVSRTEGVINAFSGEIGTKIIDDYRGIQVLSSYSLIEFKDLKMVVLAEIDFEEAMIPIIKIRIRIILMSLIISLIVFLVSFFGSKRLIKPLVDLKNAALKIGKGNFDLKVEVSSKDEIGELAESFNQMADKLAKQSKEISLQKQHQIRSMIDGQESERQRLSRELHDGLGQSLIAVKMQLESSLNLASKQRESKTVSVLNSLNQSIEEVRRISNNLQPVLLDNFGITNALSQLCTDVSNVANFNLLFEIEEIEIKLSKRVQTYLFRIAQEALNNVVKHSKATDVSFNFYIENDNLILSIEDNGFGFDDSIIEKSKGKGLENMLQRANLINAGLDINTKKGKGTIISVLYPLKCSSNE